MKHNGNKNGEFKDPMVEMSHAKDTLNHI